MFNLFFPSLSPSLFAGIHSYYSLQNEVMASVDNLDFRHHNYKDMRQVNMHVEKDLYSSRNAALKTGFRQVRDKELKNSRWYIHHSFNFNLSTTVCLRWIVCPMNSPWMELSTVAGCECFKSVHEPTSNPISIFNFLAGSIIVFLPCSLWR